jgi:peptidoglycan/xylan/chitin deacetylase (PgdA/CDA1 family)
MLLALKIDADTLRGTREGVPNLVEMLRRHEAGATFLFSVGPDHTGRAIKRVFRPGFFSKVHRTSVVTHYGVKTLLYGTLLPGPDIGRRAGDVMRSVRDEGFDVGVHCWDHVKWQDGLEGAGAEWTGRQMQLACERFTDIFKEPPLTHGAAGWQMNVHALRLTQVMGFEFCSDGRGTALRKTM